MKNMQNTQPVINAILFFANLQLGRPTTAEQSDYHMAAYERAVMEVGTPFVTAKRARISRDDKILFHFSSGTVAEYGDFSLYEAANKWLAEKANR